VQSLKKISKRFLPWLICGLIFYFIFSSYSIQFSDLKKTLGFIKYGPLIFYSLLYFLIVLFVDCYALKYFMSRFSTSITFKETLFVRGVSFLLMIINYNAGQGAFAVYLKKTHKAPLAKSLGTVAFIMAADLIWVVTFTYVALFFVGDSAYLQLLSPYLTYGIPLIYVAFILWVMFWRSTNTIFIQKIKKYRWVQWLLEHDVFYIFREACLKDYIVVSLVRIPLIALTIVGTYWAFLVFQSTVSWLDLTFYSPIVLLISSIPITPAGLGTTQAAMIEFFKDGIESPLLQSGKTTPQDILLATSLVWLFCNQVYKALYGAVCLSRSSRNLFEE